MFEHSDRHDPIELVLDFTIVDQREAAGVGEPRIFCAMTRLLELLFRQGCAKNYGICITRQIERETAPATSDIEYAKARAMQQKLGRDVSLFCLLRSLQ